MKIYHVVENIDCGYQVLFASKDKSEAHKKLNRLIEVRREYSITNEIALALQFRDEILSREEAEVYVTGDYSVYEILEVELDDAGEIEKEIGGWVRLTEQINSL